MQRLVERITNKSYLYDSAWRLEKSIINESYSYYYDNEESKMEHKKFMEENGFKDSGQIKKNLGTFENPNSVWFGCYYIQKID